MDDTQRQAEQRAAAAQLAADTVTACGKLSPRERDVLVLTAKGLSQKEVAATLELTFYTVNDYKKAIYRKLGVDSAIEAAVIAAKAGLV